MELSLLTKKREMKLNPINSPTVLALAILLRWFHCLWSPSPNDSPLSSILLGFWVTLLLFFPIPARRVASMNFIQFLDSFTFAYEVFEITKYWNVRIKLLHTLFPSSSSSSPPSSEKFSFLCPSTYVTSSSSPAHSMTSSTASNMSHFTSSSSPAHPTTSSTPSNVSHFMSASAHPTTSSTASNVLHFTSSSSPSPTYATTSSSPAHPMTSSTASNVSHLTSSSSPAHPTTSSATSQTFGCNIDVTQK